MEKARLRVARNIRSLRQRRNLSQQQLAKLSGIPKSTLNHIEAAVSSPSLETVESIAKGLGVSMEELISSSSSVVEVRERKSMPQVRMSANASMIRILPDPFAGIDFYYCEIKSYSNLSGSVQNSLGKKLIFCVKGSVIIRIGGEDYSVEEGGTCIFPGDLPHSFMNRTGKIAQFIKIHYYASTVSSLK